MPSDEAKLEQFKDIMFQTLKATQKDGRERGFNICEIDGTLEMADGVCLGDECKVNVTRCPWPSSFVEFHTHPPGASLLLSPADIQSGIAEYSDYICLATTQSKRSKKGVIQCYKSDHDSENAIAKQREFIDAWWKIRTSDPLEPGEVEQAHEIIKDHTLAILMGKSPYFQRSIRWEQKL